MTFKEKLVILRKSKGLTQDDFASAVGVSRQAVYKWESGQSYPEVPKLLEMKMLFTISIDELLDDSYDLPVPEKKRKKRAPKPEAPKAEAPKAAPTPKAEPVAPKVEAAPAPKAEPIAPKIEVAPAPKAEPVAPKIEVAPAPKAETVAPKIEVAPAPKVEAELPKINVAPAPKAEPVAPKIDTVPAPETQEPSPITLEDLETVEEAPVKKGGFFDRIFGRR